MHILCMQLAFSITLDKINIIIFYYLMNKGCSASFLKYINIELRVKNTPH